MNNLSKEQKLEGLAYAYLRVLATDNAWIWPHICDSLVAFLYERNISTSRRFLWEYFPEFVAQRPKDKGSDSMWWPESPSGNRSRLRAIEKAIELIENK